MVVRPLAAPSPGRTFEFCLERSSQGLDPLVKRLEMVIETYRNLNQRVQTPGPALTYQQLVTSCPLGQRSQLADRTRAQLEGERGPGFFLMVVCSSGCFPRQNVRVLPGEEQLGWTLWLRDSRWSLRHIEILTRGFQTPGPALHTYQQLVTSVPGTEVTTS